MNLNLNCFMLWLQREPPKHKAGIINSLQGVWSDNPATLERQASSKQNCWLADSGVGLSVEFQLGIIFLLILFKSVAS